MPALTNFRQEAFARARAKGAFLDDAYEAAGYAVGKGHSSRLAKLKNVAARIAELRLEVEPSECGSTQMVVSALFRMADRCDYFDTPERMREVRMTLLEARRVQKELFDERREERARLF